MLNDRFIREITLDWNKVDENSYLREIEALRTIDTLTFDHNITFFVGENGTGKSTLLEAIAVAYGFNAEGGNKNYCFSTYESHSELYKAVSMIKGYRKPDNNYFLRAESFYNVASKAEEYRDGLDPYSFYKKAGGRPLHEQSHGESFLALMQGNFAKGGIFLLDEPEAALSPQRQLSLLITLHKAARNGSQFIIASHSPILLGTPGCKILSFDDGQLKECSYTDTESYQVMEMFINNREYLISRLLSDD